jgi:hypothetical protein
MATFDQPRTTDTRLPATDAAAVTDPGRRALLELAAACEDGGLRSRLREYGNQPVELRIWDPNRGGCAVTIGCTAFEDPSEADTTRTNQWFTHGGQRLVLTDDPAAALRAVQARIKVQM